MLRVALVIFGLLARSCISQETECSPDRPLDLFLLLDASGSVTETDFNHTLEFVETLVDALPIGPDSVRIGLATFSASVDHKIKLDQYTNKANLMKAVFRMRSTTGNTNTHKALEFARTEVFGAPYGGRDSAPNFLVLLTDGESSHVKLTAAEAKLLAQEDITVIAIGVGSFYKRAELDTIASSPDLVYDVKAFRSLNGIKDQLIADICRVEPVDGEWSEWTEWSECSKTCGGGTQFKDRTCTDPAPSNGGEDCQGLSQETRACNEDDCSTVAPVDGKWSEWTEWSECSKTCGGGEQSKDRTCTNPAPSNGGEECQGLSQETQGCNEDECSTGAAASVYTSPKGLTVQIMFILSAVAALRIL